MMEKYFKRQRMQSRVWPPRMPDNDKDDTQSAVHDKHLEERTEDNRIEDNKEKRA